MCSSASSSPGPAERTEADLFALTRRQDHKVWLMEGGRKEEIEVGMTEKERREEEEAICLVE